MIEFRWLQNTRAGDKYQDGLANSEKIGPPVLQYRYLKRILGVANNAEPEWFEWCTVPTVIAVNGVVEK